MVNNQHDILRKFGVLLAMQSATLGVDLSKELYKKREINPISFTDFLLHKDLSKLEKKSESKVTYSNEKKLPTTNYDISSYNVSVRPEDRIVYEFKDGVTRQISGKVNKESPRDYLIRKFTMINALNNQINGGNN